MTVLLILRRIYGKSTCTVEKRVFDNIKSTNEPLREKTNVLVSDLVQHKPGCTATEDG